MNMSTGIVNRAFTCAFLGLILCASPAFAQRAPNRNTPRPLARRNAQYVPNRYILFLQDEPVSARFVAHEQLQTAAVAYRQQIEAKQQSLMRDLAGSNIQVAGSVSTVMNAVFVVATPDRLAELRSISGVIGVMPERRIMPSLNKATSLANAPAAWAQTAIGGQSNAGNGIKIGILDTGIDQTNPAFNDSGFSLPTVGTWPKCNVQSDCTNFTNKKVIVARSYVPMIGAGSSASNPAADSQPDDFSARDRDGHGSAVAASAAAVQNSAGAVPFSGMAPKAYLGSYKIYGSDGVSGGAPESVLIIALNAAVTDGMDIINMSSGGPAFTGALDDVQCGNAAGVPCDPLAQAFETAARGGLVITVSAGNNGDVAYSYPYYENYPYFNSITSPAIAPSVIAVGATISSHVMNPAVSVAAASAPASLKYRAAAMSDTIFYPSIFGGNSAPLVDVTQAPISDNGQGCSAFPAGSLTDSFALIQRGGPSTCTFDAKAINAANAGAIGIVFYMADSSTLASPIGICQTNASGTCDFYGPAVMISLSDGQALKAYVDANPGAVVTIDMAGIEQTLSGLSNTLASFSSFGPTPDGLIKPDMVATGGYDGANLSANPNPPSGIYTVGQNYDPNGELYTSSRFLAADGTSFAAPLVAGAAALVKQAHPTWTATQIKSALVNNSAQDVTVDDFSYTVDVEWMGAGRLDANAAVVASVTAEILPVNGVSQGTSSSLSFGYLKSGVALPKPIAVTVTNKGTSSVTLAVAVVAGIPATGATVTTDKSSLTIAAGASATLNVTLSGTVPGAGEYNGSVNLTSASPAVSLHIPYMFLVGDASYPNVIPLYGTGYYGAVGQDLGPIPVQVVDSWGVPVAGIAVSFTVAPRGSVSLKPVPGTPGGTNNYVIPFQPSNCTPSSSTTSVTCTTNSYGIAWIEVIGGATAIDPNNPATIDAVAAGMDETIYVGLLAQPTLTNVTDAGAYGSTIAPGSYVALFGTNLIDPYYQSATSGDSADTTFSSGRLPLVLDATTVSFDAPATGSLPAISVPGYVYFASPNQVNIYAPWELENYPSAQMKVTMVGESVFVRTNVVTVPLNNYAPAFLMNGGPPASFFVADARDNNTGALIGTSNPATAGEILQLYCNGLGPVTNQPASGDPAPAPPVFSTTTTPVTVTVGGKNAQVYFNGLAYPFVGLYLVDIALPSGLSPGNQPITISIGGKTSPTSITASGTTYTIVLPVK